MKILFVVHDFFPKFFGGTERYVLNVAKQLQRTGNNVKVLTYGLVDSPELFTARHQILHRIYTYEGVQVICTRHREIPIDQGYRVSDDIVEDIADILREEKPDIIHIAHPMRLSAVVSAAKQLGFPVVLTITDFWLLCARGRLFKPDYSLCNSSESGKKCRLQCNVDDTIFERCVRAKQLFDAVDVRIAPSRFLIEIFKSHGWDAPIHHISHGMDYKYVSSPQRIQRENGNITFGYLGVVSRFKGIDVLIKSFMNVKARNIRLDIYGNYVGDDGTIELVKEAAGIDERIRSKGRFDHEELSSILSDIDIVVTPSTTLESYGLVVIESLAYGVPVIASDIVGSAYEFIQHGINGMIFPIADHSKLDDIIRQISEQPSLVAQLQSNITPPPRLEEEVFSLEKIYKTLI
jgi:glycosyltransferase involved in cell wall biosynthesis